jgi:hypothetical protein
LLLVYYLLCCPVSIIAVVSENIINEKTISSFLMQMGKKNQNPDSLNFSNQKSWSSNGNTTVDLRMYTLGKATNNTKLQNLPVGF